MEIPSASRANKAGARLRHMQLNPGLDGYDLRTELDVLDGWRSQFQGPMVSTDMSVRSAVGTVTGVQWGRGMVKQRFKRQGQIIAKLVRSQTRLSKMEDIGGCRAILPDVATVDAVANRIYHHATTVDVVSEDDYIRNPRRGGYRARHLHCIRDGVRIEIQLRTRLQHLWAERVEAWDGSTGQDIKHEAGPPDVVRAFATMSTALAEREGEPQAPLWASLTEEMALRTLRIWVTRRGDSRGR